MSMFQFYKDVLTTFWGDSIFQLLFYYSLIIIFMAQKDYRKRTVLLWYPVVCLVCLINPVTYILAKKMWGTSIAYYCRQFSLLPIALVLAYAMVMCIRKMDGLKKLSCVMMLSGLIIWGGRSIYAEEWYTRAENRLKVPTQMIQICEWLEEQIEQPTVAVCDDLESYIRQYDASVHLLITREMSTDELRVQLNSGTPDVDMIMSLSSQRGADYIVIPYNQGSYDMFMAESYIPDLITEDYLVYKVSGYPGIRYNYDTYGRKLAEIYVDENGNTMLSTSGYAKVSYVYDSRNRISEIYYFDIDDKPYYTSSGYSGRRYIYNTKDVVYQQFYLDEAGNVVSIDDGSSGWIKTFDSLKRTTSVMYVDAYGSPVILKKGYSGVKYIYEGESNRVLTECYIDTEGNSVDITDGYSTIVYEYNDADEEITRHYYDKDGKELEID